MVCSLSEMFQKIWYNSEKYVDLSRFKEAESLLKIRMHYVVR